MPKYAYKCKECDHAFEVFHPMSEKMKDCEECDSVASLFRIPFVPDYIKKPDTTTRSGNIVKEFIKNTKKDIEQEKKEMQQDLKNGKH